MKENFEQNNQIESAREDAKSLFDKLNPRDQLLRLMLLIDMPRGARPSEDLTIAERERAIIDWADSEGPGLQKLSDVLIGLIQKQA